MVWGNNMKKGRNKEVIIRNSKIRESEQNWDQVRIRGENRIEKLIRDDKG